jgi:hypothetical protein
MTKPRQNIRAHWKSITIALFMLCVLLDLIALHWRLSHIDSNKTNMIAIKSNIRSLESNVSSIESRLVDNNMKSTKTSPIPHDVNIRTNQSYSRSNNSETASIKTDLGHLKNDIHVLKRNMSSIESKLNSVERTQRLER